MRSILDVAAALDPPLQQTDEKERLMEIQNKIKKKHKQTWTKSPIWNENKVNDFIAENLPRIKTKSVVHRCSSPPVNASETIQ